MTGGDDKDTSFVPSADGERAAFSLADIEAALDVEPEVEAEQIVEKNVDEQAVEFFTFLDSVLQGELRNSKGELYSEMNKGLIKRQLKGWYEDYRHGQKELSQEDWQAHLVALENRSGPLYNKMTRVAPSGEGILEHWEKLMKKIIETRIEEYNQSEVRQTSEQNAVSSAEEQEGWTLETLRQQEVIWTDQFVTWVAGQNFTSPQMLRDVWLEFYRQQVPASPVRPGTLSPATHKGTREVTLNTYINSTPQEINVKVYVGHTKSRELTIFLDYV